MIVLGKKGEFEGVVGEGREGVMGGVVEGVVEKVSDGGSGGGVAEEGRRRVIEGVVEEGRGDRVVTRSTAPRMF